MHEPEAKALTMDDIKRLKKLAKESSTRHLDGYLVISKSLYDNPGSREWFELNHPDYKIVRQQDIPLK